MYDVVIYMCIGVYACVYSLQCVLMRIPCGWCLSACSYNKLATRMAHGVLREFDPLKESIEDFRDRFKFYCLVNNIHVKEEAVQDWRRALFVTLLGHATFAKLKTLAIIFAVHRFHQYLYGRQFTLVTDHRPLCKIFCQKDGIPPLAAARMQHWALLLSACHYKIEYIAGSANYSADCM